MVDLSKLKQIASQEPTPEPKVEPATEPEQTPLWIEATAKGYTIAEDASSLFQEPAIPTGQGAYPGGKPAEPETLGRVEEQKNNKKEGLPSFQDAGYKKIYRALYNFHEEHYPPVADSPEEWEKYWMQACTDLSKISQELGNTPFVHDVFLAVYAELERVFDAQRKRNGR